MTKGSILSSKIAQYNEKNQSTFIDCSKKSTPQNDFVKNIITENSYMGRPAKCPFNHHLHHFKAPQATVYSKTTFGGPASKYQDINEDSYFFGINNNASVITGVIDGSGGSECGYLGGKIANQSLSQEMLVGKSLKKAFEAADANVLLNGKGGYAAGVVVEIDPSFTINIGSKGDAKALTIRNGKILASGTTKIQSLVAQRIEAGELPSHAIHTHDKKHVIYSLIGDVRLPLFVTSFQGQPADTMILGSDGLWDVVSDYEIQHLTTLYQGKVLQDTIYSLAYQRNNAKKPFIIHFGANEKHLIPPRFPMGTKCKGDNITVQVVELV